jgi:Zn-dependent metalloprotease
MVMETRATFDVLTSLDVAAHEIGHAICTNTTNLAYQKSQGNERSIL